MNLGSRLKQLLDERGWTVTRFSREAGIPAQTVYALINRDSNKADMDILMKLLTALNMDFFTFMGEAAPDSASDGTTHVLAAAENAPEHITEKIVEKVVVKEVPAAAVNGRHALYISNETYDKILELAREEGITDDAIFAKAIEEYMELGFGYRQKPIRSIFRDMKPRSGRSGDMDSYLL